MLAASTRFRGHIESDAGGGGNDAEYTSTVRGWVSPANGRAGPVRAHAIRNWVAQRERDAGRTMILRYGHSMEQ